MCFELSAEVAPRLPRQEIRGLGGVVIAPNFATNIRGRHNLNICCCFARGRNSIRGGAPAKVAILLKFSPSLEVTPWPEV